MACSCRSRIYTDIKCTVCNRQKTIKHSKNSDVIQIAKIKRATCEKCGSTDFIKA